MEALLEGAAGAGAPSSFSNQALWEAVQETEGMPLDLGAGAGAVDLHPGHPTPTLLLEEVEVTQGLLEEEEEGDQPFSEDKMEEPGAAALLEAVAVAAGEQQGLLVRLVLEELADLEAEMGERLPIHLEVVVGEAQLLAAPYLSEVEGALFWPTGCLPVIA
jgi:hypothetical protein